VRLTGQAPFLALLIAGLWLASPAGTADSSAQTVSNTPATTVRDNIATTIESIRLSRGVPDGTVSCRGNRGGQRATLRCDVRYVDPVSVTGVEIFERNNPANVWTAITRPYTQAEDETAYLVLIDRSDPARAQSIQRATRDLAEIFRRLGPNQRVAVAAFDAKFDLLQDFTADGASVAAALDRIRAGVPTTELYRLSLEAVQRLGQFQARRKVLIIASDGKFEDTAFRHNQVAQEANRQNVRIVTIGYYERQNDVKDLQSLRRLSADTRGFFFDTPGPQRALTAKDRTDFVARLMAGVIIEAEAQARGVPNALQISLRHPQGATTSFAALLMPGVAGPDVFGPDQTMPMNADGDILSRVSQIYAWVTEDLGRAAAILIVVAILLLAFVVTGVVRGLSRNKRPAATPIPEQPAPRIVPEDPPTVAGTGAAAPVPAPSAAESDAPPTLAAAPTMIRVPVTIAWLEFNGEPGRVAMRKERIAIGRERDNDIVTDAQELTVSRHHAVLSVGSDGSFQIVNRTKDYREDPNPILINGIAKEAGKIADGDVVKLGTGNYGFLFRDARGTSVPGNRSSS
jgi:hypothetical protein